GVAGRDGVELVSVGERVVGGGLGRLVRVGQARAAAAAGREGGSGLPGGDGRNVRGDARGVHAGGRAGAGGQVRDVRVHTVGAALLDEAGGTRAGGVSEHRGDGGRGVVHLHVRPRRGAAL